MIENSRTFFAPQLCISSGITDLSFYEKALGGVEIQRWSNADGTVHASEWSIDGAIFHIHEEKQRAGQFHPKGIDGTTVLIGLFVPDVDAVMEKALAAGATLISAAESYDYGYRQGEFRDPFGHIWQIERKL